MFAVGAESADMPRQLFSVVTPALRGRTAWEPAVLNPAAVAAVDPALYIDRQHATAGVWSPPQVVMAREYEAKQPQSSFAPTVLLCALAGAAAGYAATMLSRGQHTVQPTVAALGVGGQMTSEEVAKQAWLARTEDSRPSWGNVTSVAPAAGYVHPSATPTSEEAAKRAWLAKLDAPTWGAAATDLAHVAAEAARMEEMEEACYEGDDVACDSLSREEEAKRAWLARLDAPTWGAAAAAVSAVATQVEMAQACDQGDDVACDSLSREEEAKRAWLARLDVPSWGTGAKMSEEAAKKAWLARLDAPSWGKAAMQVAAAAQEMPGFGAAAAAMSAVASEVNTSSTLSAEEIAKKAWLAKLDTPSWGNKSVAPAQDMYTGYVSPSATEGAAKQAWLQRMEDSRPSWGNRPAAPSAPAASAPEDISSLYNGVVVPTQSAEQAAKLAWLAKQEAPAWLRGVDRFAMLGVGGQELMSGAPTQTQSYSGSVASSRGAPMTNSEILVQGGSLRTWSYRSQAVEQVQVLLSTEGRPLDADIELWHGPDNTPVKMRVYVENGQMRPFSAVIETPRGPNTVAIRNIGQIEFPIAANVIADHVDNPSVDCISSATTIQGGALRTYPFDPSVDSVEVLLKTDGRPLNARIELLQGPNNNKQIIELYTEDGNDRPFFCVLETPGSGNVVRVVNTAPVEFPMTASVVPHSINDSMGSGDVVIGGDAGW